jgi:hypothetical protein
VDWIQVAEFRSEKLKIRVHLGDLGIDDKIILKGILCETGCEVVNWIRPAQDVVT